MITNLYELIDVADRNGKITSINMCDEKTLYIKGKAKNGDNFTLSLTFEKEEQENA
jgi:hypothetical protein